MRFLSYGKVQKACELYVNSIIIWHIGWVLFLKLRLHYSSLPTLVNRTEVLKMLIFSQPPHDEPLLPRKYIWVNFMHHHSLKRVNKVTENIYKKVFFLKVHRSISENISNMVSFLIELNEITVLSIKLLFWVYSELSIKRTGCSKQTGGKILSKKFSEQDVISEQVGGNSLK